MRSMATAAVAVALLAAGCGGSDEPPAAATVTSTTVAKETTSTTADGEQAEEAVLSAYLAATEAYDDASDPPDPEHPALVATQTGPALEQAVRQLSAYKATGRAGRDRPESISERRPEVVSVGDAEAVIRDCTIDDGIVVNTQTGEVVNDLVQTFLFEGHMVIEDGRWKLSSLLIEDEWEGVAGCAVQ